MKSDRDPQKIKVMFVIDFIYKITGGTENQIVKLINNLDPIRFDIYLLSLQETPWITENTPHLRCTVRAFHYNVFNHKDPRNIKAFILFTRWMKQVKPDIVMTFFKTSYILGVLAARLAGVTRVVSTRRDYGLWLQDMNMGLLRLSNLLVHGIVTNSCCVRDMTSKRERYDSSKIRVIYNGIDFNLCSRNDELSRALRGQLGIPATNKVVGILAGLRPMKRHETFLKAARSILNRRSDVDFLVIGDGQLRQSLEGRARSLGIAEHVFFVGWQEAIQPYMSLLDIGVNCSANEGLSNAVMEYMAYGVPCVVSNAGGNPELIENDSNGYVFELGNDNELADRICDLLHDDGKRGQFVSRSKEIVQQKLSLKKMIENYDRYFHDLMSAGDVLAG